MTPTLTRRILKWSTAGPMPAYERRCDSSLMDLPETPGSGEPAGHPPARPLCAASLRSRTPERKHMAGSANDGALVHEKGCDLGRTENPASQEFHNFANVTNAIIWEAVAAVTRARISIAKGRLLCEQTRELRVQAQDARNRVHALGVRAAYSVERAHLAAEWVALVAARPRLRAVGSVPRSTASVGPTRRLDEPEIEGDFPREDEPSAVTPACDRRAWQHPPRGHPDDLLPNAAAQDDAVAGNFHVIERHPVRAVHHDDTPPVWLGGSGGRRVSQSPRSEEHTSELQSHHDLVCRLLLEKKKKTQLRQTDTT